MIDIFVLNLFIFCYPKYVLANMTGNRFMFRITSTKIEKTVWNHRAYENFIISCLEQVTNKHLGTSFTKKGWLGILTKFKELTEIDFPKSKFKNRYDNLRRDWKSWYELFGKEIGLGSDNVNNTIDALDD